MTGYSNYDIFMNYCEGYMDAYNDYDDFADRTYADTLKNLLGTSSNALNPHPLGSPEWRAQNRHLERLAGGVRTEHGDADAFAKDVDFFKDQDKIVKANEHAAENQHTLRAIKEALSNLAEQGIHLAKSNPLITAAIAAGCTTAGAITAFVVHKMRNKKKKGSNFSEYNDFFLRDNWEDYTISEGDKEYANARRKMAAKYLAAKRKGNERAMLNAWSAGKILKPSARVDYENTRGPLSTKSMGSRVAKALSYGMSRPGKSKASRARSSAIKAVPSADEPKSWDDWGNEEDRRSSPFSPGAIYDSR